MSNSKIAKATSLQITGDLTVIVYETSDHGFLITTKELAKAYGKTVIKVYDARERAKLRAIKGKHFIDYLQASKFGLIIGKRSIIWTMEGFFFIGNFFRTGNIEAVRNLKGVYNVSGSNESKIKSIGCSTDEITLSKKNFDLLLLGINKIPNKESRTSLVNLLMGGR